MRYLPFAAAILAAALPFCVLAEDPPLDTPLVTDPPLKVDVADFKAQMLRVPPEKRAEFRTSYDRIAAMVDNVYLARALADKARAEGLAKDPVVQRRMQQVQEAFLADMYLEQTDKKPFDVDLERRARELYDADSSQYMEPAAVHLQEILVDLWGRTNEMARQRAQAAYDAAKSGKDSFADLVGRYSDDKAKSTNGGDEGWVPLKGLKEPIAGAIAALKAPGDITPPFQTDKGYYVLRLVERRPAQKKKFEEVKKSIIASEEARLRTKRREDLVRDIRSSPTATVETRNVEALVVPAEGVLSAAALAEKLKEEQEAATRAKDAAAGKAEKPSAPEASPAPAAAPPAAK